MKCFEKKLFFIYVILIVSTQIIFSQNDGGDDIHPVLKDKFEFSMGIYNSRESFKITVIGNDLGEEIDFSSIFGVKNSFNTLFLSFGWHFTKRWKISAEYFGLKNEHKAELENDLIFNSIIFKKGSFIKSGTGLKLTRIYISRSMFKNNKHELGLGLGVHAVDVLASIEGEVLTDEEEFEFQTSSLKALVPLPNIGLWYYYAPSNRWLLSARVDWFGLKVGDYGGSLWNIAPGINYQVFKHFGLGLNYRYFNLKADVNESDWKGSFNLIYKGPLLSITANF